MTRKLLTGLFMLCLACNVTKKETGYIQAGKLNIYYERCGKGDPILFVHAGNLDHTMWNNQVDYFKNTRSVITIDLPRSGSTSGTDTSILISDVIRTCLDKLGVNKTDVVGLSFGAASSIEFALAYPERVNKLILAAPGLQGAQEGLVADSISIRCFANADSAGKTHDYKKMAQVFTENWAIGPFRRANDMDTVVAAFVYNHVLATLEKHASESWANFKADPAAFKTISSIKNKTLVIYADKDIPLINAIAGYIHEHVAGSGIVQFTNSAHMINMEQPGRFNKVVDSFLLAK